MGLWNKGNFSFFSLSISDFDYLFLLCLFLSSFCWRTNIYALFVWACVLRILYAIRHISLCIWQISWYIQYFCPQYHHHLCRSTSGFSANKIGEGKTLKGGLRISAGELFNRLGRKLNSLQELSGTKSFFSTHIGIFVFIIRHTFSHNYSYMHSSTYSACKHKRLVLNTRTARSHIVRLLAAAAAVIM